MRATALLCVWSLAGCSSMSGPLDWITPDEFTLGSGNTSNALNGFLDEPEGMHDFDFDGTSESESTYMALTWDIPTWEGREGGMDRETQRNMALLIDHMVEEEIGVEEDDDSSMPSLRDGAPKPPWWLPYGFGGGILLFLIFMGIKSRGNGWH